jgi:hypothetical protein
VRFGFKMWVLASSSGYIMNMQPYPGIAEKGARNIDLGASSNVVYYFANQIHEYEASKVVTLTFDNYFTSIPLLRHLKNDFNFTATGTMRKKRIPNCPDFGAVENGERGQWQSWFDDEGVQLVAWHDNRMVVVASTCKNALPLKNVERFSRKDRRIIEIPCPNTVCHYNNTMGGVDLADSNIARCRSAIRGKKWYYPILLYLLDASISNAWLLYRRVTKSTMSLPTFRSEVAVDLLACNRAGRKPSTSIPNEIRFDGRGHLVIFTEKQNRCAICQEKF